MEDSRRRRETQEQRLLRRCPCNYAASSVRRVAPRRALSLPERPRTCPQYLSPDPRWTAAETWRRAEADPRDLARPRRSSRRGLHTPARNVDRLRRRCGNARDSRPAVELFHLGGRVAATVRPAFDRESHPAPSPHLHDGKLSYEHRKEARWLTMSVWRTAGSTRARTRR